MDQVKRNHSQMDFRVENGELIDSRELSSDRGYLIYDFFSFGAC